MKFTNYTENENYYEFLTADGAKYLIPSAHVVLVTENNSIAVKNTAARCTIGYIVQ